MGISFTDFTGGSSKSNDFAINIGSSGNNVFELDRTYDDGSYAITIVSQDSSFDIYAIGTDGSYVGYTNSNKIDANDKFNKLVILGLPNNDEIFFEYRGKINTPLASGSVSAAGAYISSVSVSSLNNIDDTTTITGGNFANNVEVYFISQSNAETAAKNIVVTSINQLIVTRPDSFDPNDSPYTIKVVNPGIPTPDGSNLYKLNNSVTAGTNPIWVTDSTIIYNTVGTNNIALVATDTENSDIDYALISGILPSGLSLNEESGVISGTLVGSANDGDVVSITVRATDAGGNFLDKTFNLTANNPPTWVTSSGSLIDASIDGSYSFQLVASNNGVGGTLSYSIQSGSLPNGLSLNASTGEISGTTTQEEIQTFTIRVVDEQLLFADREFTIQSQIGTFPVEYLVIAGGGGGGRGRAGTGAGGGGGAGGYRSNVFGESSGGGASAEPALNLTVAATYTVTVGNGGSYEAAGEDSLFDSIVSSGGGQGANGPGPGFSGGSGGGGAGGSSNVGGTGTPNQGFSGGTQLGAAPGAGGGGAGSAGPNINTGNYANGGPGGSGVSSSITGSAIIRAAGGAGGNYAAGGTSGNKGNGAANSGNGGGGGNGADGSTNLGGVGGSGVVILKYPNIRTISVGPGLTYATDSSSVPGYKITTFTSGSDTVTFS